MKTEVHRWVPGSGDDGKFEALLDVARRTDAVWDPECDLVCRAITTDPELLSTLSLTVFTATVQSQPVAFAIAKTYRDEVWLTEVFVHRDFRKAGIAADLVRHLVADCSRSGVQWVLMEFDSFREASRRLATRTGFSAAGRLAYPPGTATVEFWIQAVKNHEEIQQ